MLPFQKKHINLGEITRLKKLLRDASLHTVCESARCPNIGECFCKGVATFLIAGDVCTRRCRFCAVKKGKPLPLDTDEPQRIAKLSEKLNLNYVVITSVTRDDLPDGAAAHFVNTIQTLRAARPQMKVEFLVPDFKGDRAAAEMVFASHPDVFAHNLETAPRLYKEARSGADYQRSLQLLAWAAAAGLTTKSGLMLGLGETQDEVLTVMDDLRAAKCNILTLGQYLAPTAAHYPVREHITDKQFESYRTHALKKGFSHCAASSYVRSSYLAQEMI